MRAMTTEGGQEIKSTQSIEFRFVPSADNLADIGSRKADPDKLVTLNW